MASLPCCWMQVKIIKEKLKRWNRDVSRDIKTKKYIILGIITSLDAQEELNGRRSDKISMRKVAKND